MGSSQYTVCLLHPREVLEYEMHGMTPGCRRFLPNGDPAKFFHTHISMREADTRVLDGHGRYLDEGHRYMAAETAKVWGPAGQDGQRNLQLVAGCVRGRAGQFRVAAGALGAHGRNTSVRATNHIPVVADVSLMREEL